MKEKRKSNPKSLAIASLFVAIITILSQVAIPMPFGVPLTLQTFAVALCGYVLSVKWGVASIAAYVLLGAVGVPVFSGFKGGVGTLFGVTGGFILGFIVFNVFCGFSSKFKKPVFKILIGIAGLAICHIVGIIQFAAVYGTTLINSALMVSVPYILKDIVSVVAAFFLSIYIIKLLKRI